MATSIYKGETDLLVTRYTLDTSCFSGPLSASSWSATTKLGQVFAFVSRLSSARGIGSTGAGRLLAKARKEKSVDPHDPGPDKIRSYLMKNKMTARIVRF